MNMELANKVRDVYSQFATVIVVMLVLLVIYKVITERPFK